MGYRHKDLLGGYCWLDDVGVMLVFRRAVVNLLPDPPRSELRRVLVRPQECSLGQCRGSTSRDKLASKDSDLGFAIALTRDEKSTPKTQRKHHPDFVPSSRIFLFSIITF